jgi:hypothetical protein
MSIVTDKVAKNVLEGMININETRRNIDASIEESRCVVFTPSMIEQSIAQFNYNVGRVSDGKLIRLDEKEVYFKITVNIGMIDKNSRNVSYIYRANERAAGAFPSVASYIDGLKIPDNEVLFYPTWSNVDVFVPLKYINRILGSEVLIERKKYNQFPYIRYYEKSTSGQSFEICVDEFKLARAVIKERTVMIFVNKKLYVGNRNVLIENNKIIISIFQELTNSELEIVVDSGISYFLIQAPMNPGNIGVFEVPETYIDSIHGPLSKFSCYFFSDGKRLLNDEIKEEGRLHFTYDFEKSSSAILAMYITDIGYIRDSGEIFYGSDYYLYNMTGVSPLSNIFKGLRSNTIFDDHIDFYDVLSKDGALYNRQVLNSFLDEYYKLSSPEDKVIYALQDRPYLMRTFLENYGRKIYTYTVDYNGTDPFVFIGLPEIYEIDEKRTYDININALHISSYEIEIINKNITDIFKIPSRLFKSGKNVVEINVIEEREIEFVKLVPEDIGTVNGGLVSRIPLFKNFITVNDIYVLERNFDNPSLRYPNSYNSGYSHFKDAEISYDESTKELVITYAKLPDNEILIYNSNFATAVNYQKPIESTSLDVLIPLYTGTPTDPVPFIPKGKLEVYAGNDKMIQGIDYFIKHPINEDKAAGTFIVVKRAILPGTIFDIYFSNIITKKVIEKEGYFKNNPYGLFYLGNLEFPFSLKYLDVHVNNKLCTEADIDILSDKLIRIHSLPVPMFDLSIESTFVLEDEYLDPFIALYEEDDFEKYIASLFNGVYYNRPYIPNENNPDYNEIYRGFIDSVDSVFKRPNPLAREALWIPSYNTDPEIIGISNDGEAMGGNNIYASIVAGDMYVVAGEGGRVASCNVKTTVWNAYDSEKPFTSDGTHFEGNITSIVFYIGLLIFATDAGEIGFYDIVNNKWGYPGDTSTGINLNLLPHAYFPGAIYKALIVDNKLVIMGEGGNVTSYNFQGNTWYAYTDFSRVNALTANGVMDTIYDAYVYNYYQLNEYITVLIVVGKNGELASGFYHSNLWTKSDGTKLHPINRGSDFFDNGESREHKDIRSATRYLNYLVLHGKDGLTTLYDLDKRSAYAVGDLRNISNDGKHNGYKDVNAAIVYNDAILITGGKEGRVTSYFGENEHWNEYNGGSDISDDGQYMQYNAVNTIAYTFVDTSYIIFAGDNGKVASYNVDVHELAFRFNLYKSAFLTWYTTPGNAYIDTGWKLPEEVMNLFTIYKEEHDLNYDVHVAGGDTDIIADIDMNDRGRYPKSYKERRQYMAEFIKDLDDGYTADEAWQKYMESKHKYILYPCDVIPLACGDEIVDEEDIDISNP